MKCAKSSVTLDQLIEDLTAIRAEHGMGAMPVGFFTEKRLVPGSMQDFVEHKLRCIAKLEASLGEPFLAFELACAQSDLGVRTEIAA
jgi:hypothetical protein